MVSTHLKNMLVKLDHFPKYIGMKIKKYLSCHHPVEIAACGPLNLDVFLHPDESDRTAVPTENMEPAESIFEILTLTLNQRFFATNDSK